MGGWFSKNEESKTVETNGQITNNVVIDDTVNIHNLEIIIMLFIITVLKLIEFVCVIYNTHRRKLKKRFMKSNLNLNNSSSA